MVIEESRGFVVERCSRHVVVVDVDDARRLGYKPCVEATQTLHSNYKVLVDHGKTLRSSHPMIESLSGHDKSVYRAGG